MLIYEDTQVGDEIICINNRTMWGKLTKGKTYVVTETLEPVGAYATEWVAVVENGGAQYWYYVSMFEPKNKTKAQVTEGWTL